jgi:hypothetical protein
MMISGSKLALIHMDDRRLPVCFECPQCCYDLSGAELRRCPECGRRVEEVDVVQFESRLGTGEASRERVVVHLSAGLGVALFLASWLGAIARDIEVGMLVGFVGTFCVLGSLGIAWAGALASPRPLRGAWRLAWLKSHWILHVMWLGIPLFGACLAITGLISKEMRGATIASSDCIRFASYMAGAWVVCLMAAIVVWVWRWNGLRQTYGLRAPALVALYFALAICVFAFVMASGSMIITFTGRAIARWIHPF